MLLLRILIINISRRFDEAIMIFWFAKILDIQDEQNVNFILMCNKQTME